MQKYSNIKNELMLYTEDLKLIQKLILIKILQLYIILELKESRFGMNMSMIHISNHISKKSIIIERKTLIQVT